MKRSRCRGTWAASSTRPRPRRARSVAVSDDASDPDEDRRDDAEGNGHDDPSRLLLLHHATIAIPMRERTADDNMPPARRIACVLPRIAR